jgi:AraC-like DNA-binding protein
MNLMRAAVLANFVDVVRQLGLNPEAQLRAVGLSTEMLATPDRLISSDAAVQLMENAALESGCDTLGLRMSEPRPMSQFGVVSLLIGQQRTMRDALQMIFKYLPLINPSLALQLEETEGVALLHEEVLSDCRLGSRQTSELAMAANVKVFRAILGPNWHPRRVYFRHPAPKSRELHHRIFGCQCEFSSDFAAMAFPARDLDMPNPLADPLMARYAMSFIGSLNDRHGSSAVNDVRRSLYLLLPLAKASIKQTARSIGCSVRKLQLDLDHAGMTFGKLLDEVRHERAELYLGNPQFDMGQIASLLGYSHQGSFTRWFKGRFGLSPSAWREAQARHE